MLTRGAPVESAWILADDSPSIWFERTATVADAVDFAGK